MDILSNGLSAIAKDLSLDERIEQYNRNKSFITLKDRKEKFLGIVSKHYIDQINKYIREKLVWEKSMHKYTSSGHMV